MPQSPPRICHRCRRTTCDCQKKARAVSDRERGTAAERGYDYQWQQFTKRYLAAHPLCVDCLPRATAAVDVHHVKKLKDNPDYKYDEQWLMGLCHECHAVRTARGE